MADENVDPATLANYLSDVTGVKQPEPELEPEPEVKEEPKVEPEPKEEPPVDDTPRFKKVFGDKYADEESAWKGIEELNRTVGDLDDLKTAKEIVDSFEATLKNPATFKDGIIEIAKQFGVSEDKLLETLGVTKPSNPEPTTVNIEDDDFVSGADVKKMLLQVQQQTLASAKDAAVNEVFARINPIIGPQLEARRVAELKEKGLEFVDNPEILKGMKEMDKLHSTNRMHSDEILYYAQLGRKLATGKIVELLGDKITRFVAEKKVSDANRQPDPKGGGGGKQEPAKPLSQAESYMEDFRRTRV